jgi:hypothetical protein
MPGSGNFDRFGAGDGGNILAIYYLSKCELSPDASELIPQVDNELRRVVGLSEEALQQRWYTNGGFDDEGITG